MRRFGLAVVVSALALPAAMLGDPIGVGAWAAGGQGACIAHHPAYIEDVFEPQLHRGVLRP